MKAIRLLIVSLVLIVSGCGGGGGGTTAPAATSGTLRITNNTGQPIDIAYVSLTTDSSWGTNQLTSSIIDGSSRDITNIPAGSYDVQVTLADGTVQSQMGVSITGGNTSTVTFSAPAAATGSLQITNTSGQAITALYVTPSTATTWGTDQLGGGTIPDNTSFTLTGIPPDTYDVEVVLADGTIQYQWGVSIVAGTTTTLTFGAPAATAGSLQVNNSTGQQIDFIYLAPAGSGSWGLDQMSCCVLPNGSNFTVTNIPAGSYDVQVVLADGTSQYQYGVGIVAGTTTTVTFGASGGGTGTVQIVNASGLTITSFYLALDTATSWGTDRLGGGTIANGASYSLTNIPVGSYYALANMSDGTTRTNTTPVALPAGGTLTFTVN